ncbi:MAG: beta-ketoacyl-[acyl-carrier-protein] synthase family protein [Planctomycetota bacterium]|nr:MAG: beta-ketoacyl-[acyl-carrier-protein] synthase family protein [Planctomycetota bacterium]GDY08245.1 3-oxoacyl-ACP synthase [Planctomycetia bacterium]
MSESAKRVVITGLGLVSPIGIGIDRFEAELTAGRSGIAPISLIPYSAAPGGIGAEVRDLTDETAKTKWLKGLRKSFKVYSRDIQLGVLAAILGLEHSGLKVAELTHERIGVEFGSNQMYSPPDVLQGGADACADENHEFHFDRWGQTGLHAMEPLWLLKYLPNMPSCHISILADARGPSNSLTLNEASGNASIGEAIRIMRRGQADVMITGATGTRTASIKGIHAALQDELANHPGEPPETWSRPFDATRNGQVLGEGAGAILLETEAFAAARGATVYGAILGTGSSCVIDKQGRPNYQLAFVNAAKAAFRDAGVSPDDIGHINAFGLGSTRCDAEEAAAIHDLFGTRAEQIPVTAFKSQLGNSGAGSGPLELAASLLGLRAGVVYPTLNYRTPDPACRLNIIHSAPAPISNKLFLKLSTSDMGQATALIAAGV